MARGGWRGASAGACLLAAAGASCALVAGEEAAPASSRARFRVGYRVLDFAKKGGGKRDTLTVAVWYPTSARPKPHTYGGPTKGHVARDGEADEKGKPYPLLVFSHGYGGSGLGAVFFTEKLAARGWIVAAPDHHDKHTAVRIRSGRVADFDRLGLLRHAGEISRSGPKDRGAYLYRLDEMKSALDGMLASEAFGKLIDRKRIAVGGHSFGGFTALGLCGTLKRRREPLVKAVLLFSTGAGAYLFTAKELGAVRMPSMLFLGERERSQQRGSESMAELAEKVYGNLSPPKYFLEVQGASHFSFNNGFADTFGARLLSGNEKHFEVIRRYSIAFLEKHVAGRADADAVLARKDPRLTRYERHPPSEKPKRGRREAR